MTYLNGLKRQQFDKLLLKFLPKCQSCGNNEFDCCFSPICKQKQFFCLNCQNMHGYMQHFLHQVIQSRQLCLDDQLSEDTFINCYNKILKTIKQAKRKGQRMAEKLRIQQNYIQQKIGELSSLEESLISRKEEQQQKLKQRQEILQKLRQTIEQQFSPEIQLDQQRMKIKQCIEQLNEMKFDLDQEKEFKQTIEDDCCQCYEEIENMIEDLSKTFNEYQQLVEKSCKKQNLNLNIKSKVFQNLNQKEQKILEGALQVNLKFSNDKDFYFFKIPKTVARAYISGVSTNKIVQQIKNIKMTNIKQLYLNHLQKITYNHLKVIYNECLNQRLRMLSIHGSNFGYQKHQLKLNSKKYQITSLHLSGLSKMKRFLRQQIMEMFDN